MTEAAQQAAQQAEASADGTGAQQTPASGTPVAPAATPAAGQDYESRFNGLMGMHNSQKAAWEAEKANLLAQIEAAKAPQAPASTQQAPQAPEADLSRQPGESSAAYESRLSELEGFIAARAMEDALVKAVSAFPEVQPFADLLYGDTPQDIYTAAEELAKRLNPNRATQEPAATEQTPSVPVLPSSPARVPVTDDAIAAAKDAYRKSKSPDDFARLMELKFQAQQAGQ